jgi:FlaA1/EpsC-like NDP-sugar epimerase
LTNPQNEAPLYEKISGKNILITGGTGSIGVALTKKLLEFNPRVLRIFSHDENELSQLEQKLHDQKSIRFLIGDVRDISRLQLAMENIDLVFHLASLKHVPICEYNPFEAVKTNVLGTQNLIAVAIREEVEKVIFASSDKAANPANVLGATKLLAEKLMTAANYFKGPRKTIFSSVRFGNVLGSRGSIIPLIKTKINDKVVTITDPNMTRFIMPMDQALNLMLKALELMGGGEVFVFKMCPIRVVNLIEAIVEIEAEKNNYRPEEVKMKLIGSRPGEKLYEGLMSEEESTRALELEDMFIILPHIPELFEKLLDHYSNMGTRLVQPRAYNSRDSEFLTKAKIKELLLNLNLV